MGGDWLVSTMGFEAGIGGGERIGWFGTMGFGVWGRWGRGVDMHFLVNSLCCRVYLILIYGLDLTVNLIFK